MRVAYIVGWCNGSTKGSEPLDVGSIPAPATKGYKVPIVIGKGYAV